jgi:hypothetical protein
MHKGGWMESVSNRSKKKGENSYGVFAVRVGLGWWIAVREGVSASERWVMVSDEERGSKGSE